LENTLQHTKKAFDSAALSYDEDESRNEILKWMRVVVQKIYLKNFKTGDRLLELNAGTGTDALYLAEHGIYVLATDISENMIGTIREKVRRKNAGKFVSAKLCPFDKIGTIEESNFDGIISNFGGLNCIHEFEKLTDGLSAKIKKGGKFIAVVMNKYCPWEIFYYSAKFDFKNVFRRSKKEGIDAALGNELIRTYYFTPAQFAGYFQKHFKVRKIYTLGLFTPPPFLIGIYRRFRPIVKLFMKTDQLLNDIFPFNRAGDHFIIILEKN